jgi:hypothetical protein
LSGVLTVSANGFFLVGGSANFVCKSVKGLFSFENSQEIVADLKKMGYKAMAVKNGHIVGGYCSSNEFENPDLAKEYYNSL